MALGQAERHGSLEVGRAADFVVWNVDTLAELAYRFGSNPCSSVVHGGKIVASSDTSELHAHR